jgi:hypothetical protein
LFLTALGWSLQLVQLRVLRPDQMRLHRILNSRLMLLPMVGEFAAAIALVVEQPESGPVAALALWVAIGYATLQYGLLHRTGIRSSYTEAIMGRMRLWNLVRTLAWSGRSLILLWIVSAYLVSN